MFRIKYNDLQTISLRTKQSKSLISLYFKPIFLLKNNSNTFRNNQVQIEATNTENYTFPNENLYSVE